MEPVNGKDYPLWGQFIDRKDEFIGGTLEDLEICFGHKCEPTKITDVTLEPNGKESAFFAVVGEDYTCGFDVKYGGITGGKEGWLTLSGYGGHTWRFKEPKNGTENG